MTVRFYADAFRCAIFDEAPGGGDPLDPASLMNRPAVDPMSWLPYIYFHSDLNYYRIAAKNMSVVVNHPALAGAVRQANGSAGDTAENAYFYGQTYTASYVLLNHNLGYVPKFFCMYDGKLMPHGLPVQQDGPALVRFVTAYATTTSILLYERAWSSDVALSAANRTYQVIVFHDPVSTPTDPMLDIGAGIANFGQGKFRGGEPHLRADGLGDVLWPIATSRSAAVRNGGIRAWYPNGGYVDFLSYNGGLGAPPYLVTSAGV